MIKINSNVLVGIVFTLFGIIYSLQAYNLPKATIGNPWAPIYFPLGLGILMTVLGIVLTIAEYSRGEVEKKAKEPKNKNYIKLIIGTIILGIIYALIFNTVGFRISTLIFLGGILTLVNGHNAWKTNIIIAVCFTFGVWYVFEKIFMTTLP